MTNLLATVTVTIALSTNWTRTDLVDTDGKRVEAGRMETNYFAIARNWSEIPTLSAGPFYGPYQFVRTMPDTRIRYYGHYGIATNYTVPILTTNTNIIIEWTQ